MRRLSPIGPPASIALAGPIGMSNSSSQFEFMYPKYKVNEPSSFRVHPSYDGDTGWPFEYVNRVCAPAGWNNSRTANAASNGRITDCPALS
jgi:hypothetical protein